MANMTNPGTDPLEAILGLCAAAAPKPWYPRLYAEETGVSRDSLDPYLERLRLGGLIQLTEWVEGRGQGYILTPGGRRALQNRRDLDRLRGDKPIFPNGAPKPQSGPREGDPTTYERGELVREALLSPPNPVIGRAILAVNVLVFLFGLYLAQQRGLATSVYMHWNPVAPIQGADALKYNEIIHDEGGLSGVDYLKGTWWWRLVTCCFVHVGVLHIGMNMLALYRGGPIIESMYGRIRFLVIYLLAGIGGSCFALGWSPVGCVGASGALCGIFAAEGAWVYLNRRFLPPQLVSLWRSNLLQNLVLIVFISLLPGISGAGHLGGAVVGVIAAVLLHYQRFGRGALRWLALAGVVALLPLCVGGLTAAISRSPRWEIIRNLQGGVEAQDDSERGFEPRFLDRSQSAVNSAAKALDRALEPDLLNGRAEKRDPEKVTEAAAALAKARPKLLKIADELAEVSYQDQKVEERRKVLEQFLRKRAELCALTERYLSERREFKDGTKEVEEWKKVRDEDKDLFQRFEKLQS
jgi:membrane associated rhomboid family serine protease